MQRIKLCDIFIGNFKISQSFGVNSSKYSWIKDTNGIPILGHNGVDWSYEGKNGVELLNPFPKGNEVVCSKRGYNEGGYGWFCRMWDKTQNAVILYAHCEEILISEGEQLYFQQLVAKGDNTGWSTGPHLHCGFYRVDEKGNRLNRNNGYDGYLNVTNGNQVTWEILNPKEPGQPKQLNQYEEKTLELINDFMDKKKYGNQESATRALIDAHKAVSQSNKEIANLNKKIEDAEIAYKIKVKKLKEQVQALIEKSVKKLSFTNALKIVVETVIRKMTGGDKEV